MLIACHARKGMPETCQHAHAAETTHEGVPHLTQGIMMSAFLRLGLMYLSNDGLTCSVYCLRTPDMSRPRTATSLCILQAESARCSLMKLHGAAASGCACQGCTDAVGQACTCETSAASQKRLWSAAQGTRQLRQLHMHRVFGRSIPAC